MAEKDKKYYWLKFKRDFFKRHDIKIIEKMPNGKEYIIFYLKLLLESIDHEGRLRFSEEVPYTESMLGAVTDTDEDIVKGALDLLIQLGMIQVFDDQTFYMNGIENLIGSETGWAEKKRVQRQKGDNVPSMSPKCPIEKEIDKEKEKDSFYKGKKSKKEKESSFDIQKAEEQAKDNRKDFGIKKNKTRTR